MTSPSGPTTSGKELARVEGDLPTSSDLAITHVEKALATLEHMEQPAEFSEMFTLSAAGLVVADATKSFELAQAANRLRLLTERRAGAVRAQLRSEGKLVVRRQPERKFDAEKIDRLLNDGLSAREAARVVGISPSLIDSYVRSARSGDIGYRRGYLYDFDEELGISSVRARTWERFAEIPEGDFLRVVDEMMEQGVELTSYRVLREATDAVAEKVESGIWKLPSGRLQIRWTEKGVRHSRAVDGSSLTAARRALLRARGRKIEARTAHSDGLDHLYADLRTLLQAMDKALPNLGHASRRHLEEAMTYLHRAEDGVGKAMRESR